MQATPSPVSCGPSRARYSEIRQVTRQPGALAVACLQRMPLLAPCCCMHLCRTHAECCLSCLPALAALPALLCLQCMPLACRVKLDGLRDLSHADACGCQAALRTAVVAPGCPDHAFAAVSIPTGQQILQMGRFLAWASRCCLTPATRRLPVWPLSLRVAQQTRLTSVSGTSW